MESLEPITQADQAPFCVEMLRRLNVQRKQDYLCDVTVVAKEGNEFRAHRNVLSAASQVCLLYTSPSPRDLSTSRMPSSA